MARLGTCLAIISFLIIQIHINECKPIFIPSEILEQAWLKNINIPSERIEQQNVVLDSDQELINPDRSKRNCLTYASKQLHRSPKWMCW